VTRLAGKCIGIAILGLLVLSGTHAVAAENQTELPFVAALPDDVDTRGDWIGTYGTYAYILCGMRAPFSLYGGKGWPIDFSVVTGDPKETVRSWRSTAPAEHDRSVLLEPNALKRTPASFDDHGEVRPIGTGPDLHIRMSIPEGALLLSLYFFEIDWIQYRAYRIRIFATGQEGDPLVTSQVSDFFKGKYSRYVVIGPAELLIIIERGQSPNAQVSGIFLDPLEFPDLYMFDRTADRSITEGVVAFEKPEPAGQVAEEALRDLMQAPGEADRQEYYIRKELEHFRALQSQESASPREYYQSLEELWASSESRMERALGVLRQGPRHAEVNLLRYYAARAQCDYAAARQNARALATSLLDRSLVGAQPWGNEARLLRECAVNLLAEGRRAEASPFVEAYVAFCLQRESPDQAKENLLFMGDLALKAGVPLPAAAALAEWQRRNGALSAKQRLLLGSLYYVGGENGKALDVLKSVEPEMRDPTQRKWYLVVMFTALLRTDRVAEAQVVLERLEKQFPDEPDELDEARYRLGVHYFDKRDFRRALQCFRSLRDSTQSVLYQKMCDEYIDRILHLDSLEGLREE